MTIFTVCHYANSFYNSFISSAIKLWNELHARIEILNIHQLYPCSSQNLKKKLQIIFTYLKAGVDLDFMPPGRQLSL